MREKYINIITTFKVETCRSFVEDIAFFIYIIDFQRLYDMEEFIKNSIEKYILYDDLKFEIYLYLITNYNDLSQKLFNILIDYLINKNRIKSKNIILILEKNNSKEEIKLVLDKIENFVIKEEELLNPEKDIQSFHILEGLLKQELYEKLKVNDLNETKYWKNTLQNKEKILENIKKGEINYDAFKIIYISDEKREIFNKKLNILLFNNKEQTDDYMKILKLKFTDIIKVIGYINKLNSILKEFFVNDHKNDILKIENLRKIIKSGKMNEIEKPKIKNMIDDIHKFFLPEDFNKKNKLKDSIFFVQLYRSRKSNDINKKNESEIFEEAENDFNKLKLLFESKNWIKDIPESIMNECYRSLRNEKAKKLKDELIDLLEIYQIENFEDKVIAKLKKLEHDIILYFQNKDMSLAINCFLNFIDEFEAEQTEFYNKLLKIKNVLNSSILASNRLKNLENILIKFEINVLEPKEEDKNYLNIFYYIFYKKESILLIKKLDEKEIQSLKELDDNFFTIQDIVKCSTFIHNLKILTGKKTDKELIDAFINEIKKRNEVSKNFYNYSLYEDKIKKLYKIKKEKV